ncbi:hypothetical protein C9994_04665 [Marivirga lumbricoides]|uniref:Uncharacterized protein n=2 Tax=Marivirga lumbricoides TaxID=1046115 RepID=A0A2T4DT79_9BACT|nr:hypothetical protein C9994_04665 [Marivirga lumbricoides]
MKPLKSFVVAIMLITGFVACESESAHISKDCIYTATVEDLSGLDGCGFLFKLDNGDYLEPVWRWGFCGTPPLPEGATEDPLWDFNYVDGQRVRLGFEPANDVGSICMKGKPVIITCLEVIDEAPVE